VGSVAVALVVVGWLWRHLGVPGCAELQAAAAAHAVAAPLVYFAAFVVSCVVMIPGLLLALVAGSLYGAFWGSALVSVSSVAGALAAFSIARSAAGGSVERMLARRSWYAPVRAQLTGSGLEFVLLLRLAPLVPFTAANYACGLLPIRTRDYVLGSAIGMLPATVAYCYVGAAGCRILDPLLSGGFSLGALPPGALRNLVAASILLGVVSAIPLLVKWRRRAGSGRFDVSG
jgi:uncharacterized membrane protein YdjX (TVP38/TMEM64 family)